MAKLTLHIPDELVEAAKNEAANRSVSLSKLVSDFFRALSSTEGRSPPEEPELGPITSSLYGCLDSAVEHTREDYMNYLEKKHS